MSENKNYDYIIAGMGCAGLSLAMRLKNSKAVFDKVLLVDKDLKNKNDRTWSFWTREKNNWFDPVVYRKWHKLSYKGPAFEKVHHLSPYAYTMIKGLDFYSYCISELRSDDRFEFVTGEIEAIYTLAYQGFLRMQDQTYSARYVFNSAIRNLKYDVHDINYVQHFKGWEIETTEPCFDDDTPLLMDFRVKQYNDCRFCYILPSSKTKALIEYTGFSQKAISAEEYETELIDYISNYLKAGSYRITATEEGIIPMTNGRFTNAFGNCVINIGTAGGNTKCSSGYTFYFIQQTVEKLVDQLEKNQYPDTEKKNSRFEWYDKIFLQVLAQKKVAPEKIFSKLFESENIHPVLAFLNEESTFIQDLQVFRTVPAKEFTVAALENIFTGR